ncbi:MAG: riboflavin synthase [Deltaproteobacteria bacterium]|jgi:riboflavin synthase|nr:riboflavin synthase [Deltaproteobacteria bacterium]
MFTGIIEEVGILKETRPEARSLKVVVQSKLPLDEIKIGDSICVEGMCLSCVGKDPTNKTFTVDAVGETVKRTTLSTWHKGRKLNLERALPATGRFDGHFVSGHVDCQGRVARIVNQGRQFNLAVNFPAEYRKFIAPKGSITVNGVSLTVAEITGCRFTVAVIPLTVRETTLQYLRPGEPVNIEVDLIARYIANFLSNNLETR